MNAPLSHVAEPVYALMRVVVGFLFAFHGAQKLFGAFGGTARPIASQMGLAGVIELVGGVLVMIGLLAGIAAFISSGLMAFAYFLSHAPRGGWPIQNDGELAALFCFVLLFISVRGAGTWSVEGALSRSRLHLRASAPDRWSRA